MKKSTKGSIAAAAAAVLLMGGAGSLAYWSDSADVDGGSVTAGSLDLSNMTCAPTWTEGADTDVQLIVPGDTITKQCTGTITMTGDHISADVTLDDASVATAEAAFNLPATAGDAVDITAGLTGGGTVSSSGPISVTITVDWPYGSVADNDAQGVSTSALDDLVINAVQADPHP
ncbi:alternate-type signal peptide domain-containing protein [Nocardioides jensenii]|uniref:alternate-type signal peptide domain-containing protein n=1 Tax=Nocardioides jensenii TaxID=1843 RepID=UPI00082BEC13|nr:alternate-type signal peptide domain-containing protein [Nocardioides jensenii]